MGSENGSRGDRSRRLILDAAEELMARDGYAAVSVAQLESASGLPASSIYWHFGSKERVLIAVMERGAEQFFATLRRIETMEGPAEERVTEVFGAMADHLSEHPLFLRLLLTIALQRNVVENAGEVVDRIRAAGLAHAREISRVIGEAVDRELDDETVDAMGRLMMAAADGLVFADQVGEPVDVRKMLRRLQVMLVAVAEAEGPPRRPTGSRRTRRTKGAR